MKINSKECDEALRNFVTSNQKEELTVELLLVRDDDDDGFANMAYKICDTLTDEEIDDMENVVTQIRNEIGIDDEKA